jgi:hypothetical protein
MTNENDLMMKLMTAKQIMTKHNEIGRGGIPVNVNNSAPLVEDFKAPQATYNLPSEFMNESLTMGHMQNDDVNTPYLSEEAMSKNIHKMPQQASQDRILQSKLPDSIKQLMMEHPIVQPDNPLSGGSGISNELAEKAARLMNTKANGDVINPQQKRPQQQPSQIPVSSDLKSMIQEAVREVLSENGLITESVSKTNDVFSFRVGSHVFEGKVTKIKKVK